MNKTSHELDLLELGDFPKSVTWVCKCGKKGRATARPGQNPNNLDMAAIKNHEAHQRRMMFGTPS